MQAYGDVGNDEILFVHGFGQSRLSWSKQTSSSLTEHYRVVTFDLRGHGDSDKPDHAAAYASGEQWADDLPAVMETAGLRCPTIVGWSLGGLIIGLYLAKYGRERTAGINLVDAVTVFSPELEFFTQTFGGLLPRLASPDLSKRATATASGFRIGGHPLGRGGQGLDVHKQALLPTSPANMVNDLTRVCAAVSDLQNCVADHLRKTRQSLAAWLATQGHL